MNNLSKPKYYEHGLGRLYKFDIRDLKYSLRSLLPQQTELTQRYWPADTWLDQDGTPMCVGYGWAHWVDDGPITHPELIDPVWIYNEAQKVDGDPLPHDGSTVRAGAQVLQGQKIISNYYWASTVEDIVMAVLELGPVTVGTNWYQDMFNPNPITGVLTVSGSLAGGHCYVFDGVDTITGLFRIKNSWGRAWGKEGFAFISIEDMDKLLQEQGEACLATEIPGDIPPDPVVKPSLWQRFLEWLRKVFHI